MVFNKSLVLWYQKTFQSLGEMLHSLLSLEQDWRGMGASQWTVSQALKTTGLQTPRATQLQGSRVSPCTWRDSLITQIVYLGKGVKKD